MYLLLFYAREGGTVTALCFYELSHKVVEYIWTWMGRPEKSSFTYNSFRPTSTSYLGSYSYSKRPNKLNM